MSLLCRHLLLQRRPRNELPSLARNGRDMRSKLCKTFISIRCKPEFVTRQNLGRYLAQSGCISNSKVFDLMSMLQPLGFRLQPLDCCIEHDKNFWIARNVINGLRFVLCCWTAWWFFPSCWLATRDLPSSGLINFIEKCVFSRFWIVVRSALQYQAKKT